MNRTDTNLKSLGKLNHSCVVTFPGIIEATAIGKKVEAVTMFENQICQRVERTGSHYRCSMRVRTNTVLVSSRECDINCGDRETASISINGES